MGGQEFFGESGLAHPRRAEHGEQLTGAVCLGALEALAQHRQLPVPTHEPGPHRGVDMRCLGDSGHRKHTPCWHGLLLPLELERWHRLCLDPLPHQTPGRVADEHLAGPGGLFESGGHIHGIAHRMLGCAAHEHFAGVDPDT